MTSSAAPANVLAIVVNWNKRTCLRDLLASLRRLGGAPFDILVVDNASTDGSAEMVRNDFPEVRLHVTPRNIGGAGGFNTGMRIGLGDPKGYQFLWLLDNDVVVHPGALDGLLRVMREEPKCALAGSTLLLLDDPGQVQECGARIDWTDARVTRIGEGPLAKLPAGARFDADWVAACSLLARVDAVRQVGIWDQEYFVLWDDMEWGIRMKRAGWTVRSTTESQVRHESFQNRRVKSGLLMQYIGLRNFFYFLRRNAPKDRLEPLLRLHLERALNLTDNSREAGKADQVYIARLGLRDALRGRMGPPPPELADAPKPRPAAGTAPPRLRRAGFMLTADPESARAAMAVVHKRYPGLRLDTLLFTDHADVLRERFPNRRRIFASTLVSRLKLLVRLPLQYQATVSQSWVPRYFYEELLPYTIRVDEKGELEVRRRDLRRTARLAVGRWRNRRLAAKWTRALVNRPLPPVDYFTFR
ncbi:MAG: glycosyltransferase family 2 protein [Candidatus Sumerlaeia bacterium]|nr:glycosyltransferase family 2 protein [Candidatus Sumerlaeia bacterium]